MSLANKTLQTSTLERMKASWQVEYANPVSRTQRDASFQAEVGTDRPSACATAPSARQQTSLDSLRASWRGEYGDENPLFSGSLLARYVPGDTFAGESFSRASTATYKDSAGNRQTVASGAKRDAHFIGGVRHLLLEISRTNHFLNSGAPATQTSASLGTGTYTLWMEGTGSIAVAGTTATITGAGTATAGAPVTFTVTVAGTVTYTVTGSPTLAQAENGATPSSYIPTAGAQATRLNEDYSFVFNPLPQVSTCYVKLTESGSNAITNARVFQIGATNVNPTAYAYAAAAGKYTARHQNVGTVISAAVATPALNDLVELRMVLNADGSVMMGQSVNSGAEVVAAASAAEALAAAWNGPNPRLFFNGLLGNYGMLALQSFKMAAGVQSLADMRAA